MIVYKVFDTDEGDSEFFGRKWEAIDVASVMGQRHADETGEPEEVEVIRIEIGRPTKEVILACLNRTNYIWRRQVVWSRTFKPREEA